MFNFVQMSLSQWASLLKIDPLRKKPTLVHNGDPCSSCMTNPNGHTVPDVHTWTQLLPRYRAPSPTRSVIELVVTAGLFVLLWILMCKPSASGYWLCLALAVPNAGLLVPLLMVQHDCGHGSFFRHRGSCGIGGTIRSETSDGLFGAIHACRNARKTFLRSGLAP